MGLLDFKEISQANSANGGQDEFELFAREFFSEVMKFSIISEPNRGADGGKDIIAVEKQVGKLSTNEIKWLISCKHNAHSGKSVNEREESNITDRVTQHGANGFIGFYSTLPSCGLNNRLDSYKSRINIEVFNHERIETELISSKNNKLIQRFFPKSYIKALQKKQKNIPSVLFGKYEPLLCEYCGKDILIEHLHDIGATINLIYDINKKIYVDVYVCCKGHCNETLLLSKKPDGFADEWEDISDFIIPSIFIRKQMTIFNQLFYEEKKYTKEAFEKLKNIILILSQLSLRIEDDEQEYRVRELASLPDWI